jgi:hypothetical protein
MAEHPAPTDRSNRLAAIGGWLVVAGCVLVLLTAVIGALGQSVTIGSAGVGSVALTVALAALGAGFALLAVSGPPATGGVSARVGLGFLAVGIGATLISSVIAGGMNSDPLEERAFVVPFIAGGVAMLLGVPVTVVGLLLHAGRPRRIAAAFLGGLAVIVAGGMISSAAMTNDPSASVPIAASVVALAGLALVLASVGGLGVAAIRGAPVQEPAAA